jgi:AcrR family transcriptional regulator
VAERVVLEKGVDALNARGLAKRLGISFGSLCNAFGNLDGVVVRAVNSRCAARRSGVLRKALDHAPGSAGASVIAIGEAYFDLAPSEPRRCYMFFERDSGLQPDAKTTELQERLLEMLIRAGDGDPLHDQHCHFFLLL